MKVTGGLDLDYEWGTERLLQEKYEVQKLLGQGGTGSVYAAYDRHLRQTVAIKQIIRKELAGIKADSLWNEVAVLKQMEHPALPKIYDYFNEGEHDYMVLEYIGGITLADYIRENGPLGQRSAVAVMKKLLSVFQYLHSFSPPVIYRDLKPANIMLKEDGQIKLIDFGTAYCRQFGRAIWAGTPGFSAPELLTAGKTGQEWRESSDIYSLGAVFAYLLTGREPSRTGLGHRPVRKYNRAVSDGIEKIILRCMQEKAERRYPNVKQLQQDLCHYRKLERGKRVKRNIFKIFRILILVAGFIWLMTEVRKGIVLPFWWSAGSFKWVDGYRLSKPLAGGLILFLTGIYSCLIVSNQKKRMMKPEKNIYLTEKKTMGLWGSSLIVCCLLTALLCRSEAAYAGGGITDILPPKEAVVGERAAFTGAVCELPVTVRDPSGYKLLIQYGAVYRPEQDLILELPLSGIPEGEEVTLQVIAIGSKIRYESREFVVKHERREDFLKQ